MKIVRKKILPQYFDKVAQGLKTFEIRKDEDDIQPEDVLILDEFDGKAYLPRQIRCLVTYVLRDCPEYGLQDGYCIIGLAPISWCHWWDASTPPDYEGHFIVHVDDSHEPSDERIWGRDDIVIPATYDEGQWGAYIDGEEYDLTGIVVHWMELPEAPQERW